MRKPSNITERMAIPELDRLIPCFSLLCSLSTITQCFWHSLCSVVSLYAKKVSCLYLVHSQLTFSFHSCVISSHRGAEGGHGLSSFTIRSEDTASSEDTARACSDRQSCRMTVAAS